MTALPPPSRRHRRLGGGLADRNPAVTLSFIWQAGSAAGVVAAA